MPWGNLFKIFVIWLVLSWGFWSFVTWDLFPLPTLGGTSWGDTVTFLLVEGVLLEISVMTVAVHLMLWAFREVK